MKKFDLINDQIGQVAQAQVPTLTHSWCVGGSRSLQWLKPRASLSPADR